MSTSRPSRTQRSTELRAAAQAHMQQQRQRPLSGWLAVLGMAGVLVLRRATQLLDTAPVGLLDEREISQRDRGYRDAFHLTLALVFVLWVLAIEDGFVAKIGTTGLFDGDGWIYLILASFFTIFTLPAAALTWRWQAPQDDQDD